MFIDAEDKESVEMFEYLCTTNPTAEPYMLELMVWAYKHRHEEYEAIMEKYKNTENFVNLDAFKGAHVSAHIPDDPNHLPSKFGEENPYVRKLQIGEEVLNPEFDTITEIVN
jgi:hypothetical protein